jgi:hypothetical protein
MPRYVRPGLAGLGLGLATFLHGAASAGGSERIDGARLYAGAEIALVDLGYTIDYPDGFPDPQSEAALAALRGFLALPADTPLRASLVAALASLAQARSDGLRAAAEIRLAREQAAIVGAAMNPMEATEAVATAEDPIAWDR